MRAADVMTTDVIRLIRRRQSRLWRRYLRNAASAVPQSSMRADAWSESSARATCCTVPKSALRAATVSVGGRGGSTISPPTLARDYIKSHGRTVKDIMTRDVVTVTFQGDSLVRARIAAGRHDRRFPLEPPLSTDSPTRSW